MKTTIAFAFILLVFHAWASPDGDLVERMVRYRDMSPWERALETYRMPERERQQLLAVFRGAYERHSVPDQGLEHILLALRDERVRQKYIDKFMDDPAVTPWLGLTRDPEVLHGVAKHLEVDDWPIPRDASTDLAWGTPWGYARDTVLEILRNAPDFHEDVINWARRLDDQQDSEERAILREWWRANEHFFAEKNYKAVRPGRDLPQPAGELAASASPEEPATRIAVPTMLPALPLGELSTEQTDATSFTWMIWTAAGAALAAAIIIVLLRTTPRSRH